MKAVNKIKLQEVLIVEGKYDAAALASLVDALILTTDGFGIFSDAEKKALIQTLGRRRGLILLTDSDAAGFRIRHYVEKIAAGSVIKHAYVPALPGKESRKAAPSREGTLGVEGLPPEILLLALEKAGATAVPAQPSSAVTYTHLYEWGLSGSPGNTARRRQLLTRLALPQRLSKRALCQVLSSLYSRQELLAHIEALSPEPGSP